MPDLLDRDAQLTRLQDLLRRACEGNGGVAIVNGAAGSGKTALLDAFCAAAGATGARVLRARASEFEQELSLGVVRQLFADTVAALDTATRARVTAGAAGRAVAALGYEGEPMAAAEFSHALFWLCANLATEAPLVLAVDDAHFGDVISMQWLRYLAARLEQVPVLLVMTTPAT